MPHPCPRYHPRVATPLGPEPGSGGLVGLLDQRPATTRVEHLWGLLHRWQQDVDGAGTSWAAVAAPVTTVKAWMATSRAPRGGSMLDSFRRLWCAPKTLDSLLRCI